MTLFISLRSLFVFTLFLTSSFYSALYTQDESDNDSVLSFYSIRSYTSQTHPLLDSDDEFPSFSSSFHPLFFEEKEEERESEERNIRFIPRASDTWIDTLINRTSLLTHPEDSENSSLFNSFLTPSFYNNVSFSSFITLLEYILTHIHRDKRWCFNIGTHLPLAFFLKNFAPSYLKNDEPSLSEEQILKVTKLFLDYGIRPNDKAFRYAIEANLITVVKLLTEHVQTAADYQEKRFEALAQVLTRKCPALLDLQLLIRSYENKSTENDSWCFEAIKKGIYKSVACNCSAQILSILLSWKTKHKVWWRDKHIEKALKALCELQTSSFFSHTPSTNTSPSISSLPDSATSFFSSLLNAENEKYKKLKMLLKWKHQDGESIEKEAVGKALLAATKQADHKIISSLLEWESSSTDLLEMSLGEESTPFLSIAFTSLSPLHIKEALFIAYKEKYFDLIPLFLEWRGTQGISLFTRDVELLLEKILTTPYHSAHDNYLRTIICWYREKEGGVSFITIEKALLFFAQHNMAYALEYVKEWQTISNTSIRREILSKALTLAIINKHEDLVPLLLDWKDTAGEMIANEEVYEKALCDIAKTPHTSLLSLFFSSHKHRLSFELIEKALIAAASSSTCSAASISLLLEQEEHYGLHFSVNTIHNTLRTAAHSLNSEFIKATLLWCKKNNKNLTSIAYNLSLVSWYIKDPSKENIGILLLKDPYFINTILKPQILQKLYECAAERLHIELLPLILDAQNPETNLLLDISQLGAVLKNAYIKEKYEFIDHMLQWVHPSTGATLTLEHVGSILEAATEMNSYDYIRKLLSWHNQEGTCLSGKHIYRSLCIALKKSDEEASELLLSYLCSNTRTAKNKISEVINIANEENQSELLLSLVNWNEFFLKDYLSEESKEQILHAAIKTKNNPLISFMINRNILSAKTIWQGISHALTYYPDILSLLWELVINQENAFEPADIATAIESATENNNYPFTTLLLEVAKKHRKMPSLEHALIIAYKKRYQALGNLLMTHHLKQPFFSQTNASSNQQVSTAFFENVVSVPGTSGVHESRAEKEEESAGIAHKREKRTEENCFFSSASKRSRKE